jgi:hypothetical protein
VTQVREGKGGRNIRKRRSCAPSTTAQARANPRYYVGGLTSSYPEFPPTTLQQMQSVSSFPQHSAKLTDSKRCLIPLSDETSCAILLVPYWSVSCSPKLFVVSLFTEADLGALAGTIL